MLLYALELGAGLAYYNLLYVLLRPWGGFATFDAIARSAALAQATSIGVFIPEYE